MSSEQNGEIGLEGERLKEIAEAVNADKLEMLVAPKPKLDYTKIFSLCMMKIQENTTKTKVIPIILPTQEPILTKKNRVRLVPDDRSSPMGVVIKEATSEAIRYAPKAVARFNAYEVASWAARQESFGENQNDE